MMRRPELRAALIGGASWLVSIVLVINLATAADPPSDSWPHWRGPLANGVAPHANPPLHWGPTTNIRWKVALPGEGSATPIIWGERVYVVAAVETDRVADGPNEPHPEAMTRPPDRYYQFIVMCLHRRTGEELWRRIAVEAVPHEGRHGTNSYASGSPTTDGERLYVSFGSRGFYAYDLDGQLLWSLDLGDMRTRRGWGESVTPVVHDKTLVINWDTEDESFLVAIDAASGQERWRVERDEATTWTTPVIANDGNQTQVIVNGTKRVRSYDLANGKLLWECGGQTVNPIPTPVIHEGVAFCVSGYRGAAAMAIPLDSRGDVTDSPKIRWSHNSSTPYVPSPIIYHDSIYFTRANQGVLTCLNVADGSVVFGPVRISGIDNLYASPVAAQDRLYFVGRDGTTVVLAHGRELDVLATNRLDDPVDASPALVGNQLFLRSTSHLYCIEDMAATNR